MHGVPLPTPPRESPPPAAAGGTPLASLLVRSGALRGRRLPITVSAVNIGRADYNDLVIADPSVSTTHARLQRKDELWVVSDLGSTNGTYVEGEPVTGETALTPGTTLRFGDVSALFEPHDEPQPGARRAAVEAAPTPPVEEPRPAQPPRPSARRPIRAAAPKQSGTPTWLIALLLVAALVIAYLFLTSS
jgi:pSer/pThr/pTyr-binding forkhead associated (FHA) protein